ncbi:MAG: Gfo/Idh/MocA family oxidoreductase [Synechococcaceae cyanobacterium SM1_2_3]|nr:Gfo/Idh/MocA family oxidoreductase [Synechococcaceae cyanobacterium SM1_2_3]
MITRRQFFTFVAGSPLFLSATAMARPKRPGASDVVRVGLIGLGGRCQDIAKTCLGIPQMKVVAVCDCFQPRLDSCMEKLGAAQGWKPYLDFRTMIEREDLDGVMVETTTHARAWVTCHAMAMGMDVYIEKPMCLTVAEGREMVQRARRWKRVAFKGDQRRKPVHPPLPADSQHEAGKVFHRLRRTLRSVAPAHPGTGRGQPAVDRIRHLRQSRRLRSHS